MRCFVRKKAAPSYQILVPPLSCDVCRLSPNEAHEYFLWFISAVPNRIDYLLDQCFHHCAERRLSPDSLTVVWQWFIDNVVFDFDKISKQYRLSTLSEYIIRDIGMYFGEVCIANNHGLQWSYFTEPKNDFFVNAPYIKGYISRATSFPMTFEPLHMVRIQALKLLPSNSPKGSPTDLLSLYQHWLQYVPGKNE